MIPRYHKILILCIKAWFFFLSRVVQWNKSALSSALPVRLHTCQRLGKVIACYTIRPPEVDDFERSTEVFLLTYKANTVLERPCFKLQNENIFVLKNKLEMVKCQLFKFGHCVNLVAPGPRMHTVIHFYFGSVQFLVKQNFIVSVRRNFDSARGINTTLNKQLHP